MIESNEFLDLFFAVMKENKKEKIDVMDIGNVLNVVFSSKEFNYLNNLIDLESLNGKKILEHKYLKDINKDGVITIKMSEKDKDEVKEKSPFAFMFLSDAFNKYYIMEDIKEKTEGMITFVNDYPDGNYELPYFAYPMEEKEERIYTDGEIENIINEKGEELYQNTRYVNIKDSTYSIIVDYNNNKPIAAEIRGISLGNYKLMCDEAYTLMRNDTSNYQLITKDKPKVYTLRCH